ncbi:MAG: hypothetical protein Kow002_01060 [Anaerolineales bacterium]
MTAYDVLKSLQTEIGARRAGTDGERRAQEWLKARAEALGLFVEMDEFTFIGSERYRPVMMMLNFFIIVASITLFMAENYYPATGLFLLYLLSMNLRKRLELRLATTRSQNVIAGLKRPISEFVEDEAQGPAILVCAHYDTPRNFPAWFPKVRNVFRFLSPLSSLGLLLFACAVILRLFGLMLPTLDFLTGVSALLSRIAFVFVLPILVAIPFYGFYALFGKKTDSPGADDNGSGTAVVMDMAQRFKKNPTNNVEVFFAWWGAEELGLFGSRQFIRRFHKKLNKETFHILNVDCVGVCEYVTVHAGQGVWKRRRTDPETVSRLERLAEGLGIKTIRSWESPISGGSSDHAGWMDRGYKRATSLIREDYRPLSLPARVYAWLMRIPYANQLEINHIHSPSDTLDVIKPAVLHSTADLAEAYVREIDASVK